MIGETWQRIEATPLEPFTIVTSNGRRYSVRSADHAGLNPRGTRVVVRFDDDGSLTIAGLHVAAIEKGMPSSGGNGEQDA
jgi:hypothetical protein